MRVKKLATTYANRFTEEQIRNIQINHIGVIEAVDLRMMSEILQKYGTKFDQKNNHQQMALEHFRMQVEQKVPDPQVREDMKRLEVFFTQQDPKDRPESGLASAQTGQKA